MMNSIRFTASIFCGVLVAGVSSVAQTFPYQNPQAPLEQRVEDLFGRLTLDEKLSLLGGTGFTVQPIPRLGVPALGMADAGQGVRGGIDATCGPATAFPCGALMASTWDTNLLRRVGQGIGEELRNKGPGAQIILGPAVNIHRSPLGGRNGEYFSEDPYLAAQLDVAYIQGVQSRGVGACIKHFACNNEEADRDNVDVTVDERTLREIYLPAFEAGVRQGGVWAVMSSYNAVNGHHASDNHFLLTDVLRKDWGFDGMVMSDWGGVHKTAVVRAGNDLEMPSGDNMSVPKLKAALADGSVTMAAVDVSVHRILRTIVRVGLLDGPMKPDGSMVNSEAHRQLALEVAEKGIVLLKNDRHVLPLDRERLKSIAVIGDTAKNLQIDALGSPQVQPLHSVQIWDGIQALVGDQVKLNYVAARTHGKLVPGSAVQLADGSGHGFHGEYFKNPDLKGEPELVRVDNEINLSGPSAPAPGFGNTDFSVRWTGQLVAPATGDYSFSFTGDDGYRVYLDGKLLIDRWSREAATTVGAHINLEAGKAYDLRVEYFQAGGDYVAQFAWQPPGEPVFAEAIAAAQSSDVAIVCVSTHGTEGEGNDRPSMDLPDNQSALIRAVAAANSNTVVVLNNGTPVTMKDWVGNVPGLVEAWFPGQEGGTAVAAVLFGDVNPSGKLADTLAFNREDYPDFGHFPGHDQEVTYAEGIYVGYRHFDKAQVEPIFCFGHGLSYTTFEYKKLKLSRKKMAPDDTVEATVEITNTGKCAGEEVAELYIHDLGPKIDKPVRELKGFSKVALSPGETRTASFTLNARDLAYFYVSGHQWKADAGRYEIEVGAASRDIRQKSTLQLAADYTEPVP